jgi:hypothetical protein
MMVNLQTEQEHEATLLMNAELDPQQALIEEARQRRRRRGVRFGRALFAISAAASSAFVGQITTSDSAQSATVTNPTCIQGQLQVAMEQGGGAIGPRITRGYTFLVLNMATHDCSVRGYPWWVVLSNTRGNTRKVFVNHRPTSLYGQPKANEVILRPGQVASFGLSFRHGASVAMSVTANCLAQLVDFRLPAIMAAKFSYEFPILIDVCDAGRSVSVTPIEARSAPRK